MRYQEVRCIVVLMNSNGFYAIQTGSSLSIECLITFRKKVAGNFYVELLILNFRSIN